MPDSREVMSLSILLIFFCMSFVGNFFYSFYEKIELKKLTVCLTCGSYQCPYCPHFASGTWVTPSIPVIIFALITIIVANTNMDMNLGFNMKGVWNLIRLWNWRWNVFELSERFFIQDSFYTKSCLNPMYHLLV